MIGRVERSDSWRYRNEQDERRYFMRQMQIHIYESGTGGAEHLLAFFFASRPGLLVRFSKCAYRAAAHQGAECLLLAAWQKQAHLMLIVAATDYPGKRTAIRPDIGLHTDSLFSTPSLIENCHFIFSITKVLESRLSCVSSRLVTMAVQGISRDGSKLIGWATLPVPLATLAVILRFLSRKSVKRIGIDDWCMLVALFIYYGLYISLVVWGPVGKVGFPQSDLSYAQVEDFLKVSPFLESMGCSSGLC